jgi:hypothetical protein
LVGDSGRFRHIGHRGSLRSLFRGRVLNSFTTEDTGEHRVKR